MINSTIDNATPVIFSAFGISFRKKTPKSKTKGVVRLVTKDTVVTGR